MHQIDGRIDVVRGDLFNIGWDIAVKPCCNGTVLAVVDGMKLAAWGSNLLSDRDVPDRPGRPNRGRDMENMKWRW